MSLECMLWAKKQKTGHSGAKLVLMCLAEHASEQNDFKCWIGRKALADVTEMSVRSVSAHLNTLEEGGFIRREMRHRDDGSRASDTIFLCLHSAESARGGEEIVEQSAESARHETVTKPSVSNDTGPSPSKMIWEKGLSLLARAYPENSEIKNRTLIGKWFKRIDGDHDRFLAVLDACEAAGSMDPVSYISKSVDNQWPEKPKPPDPKDIPADRWKINIRVAMERQEWPKTWGPPPGAKGCCVPADLVTPELLELFKPEGALV